MKEENDESEFSELENILEKMEKKGLECGKEIASILEDIRDFDYVIPLYRSAIGIQGVENLADYSIGVEIVPFSDPHFWGDEINPETVEEARKSRIFVKGERIGPEFYKEVSPNKFKKLSPEEELKD